MLMAGWQNEDEGGATLAGVSAIAYPWSDPQATDESAYSATTRFSSSSNVSLHLARAWPRTVSPAGILQAPFPAAPGEAIHILPSA
jgi:hypothetical protein